MLYPKPLPQIGSHQKMEVFYFDPGIHDLDSLPKKNWLCLAIANDDFDKVFFDDFMFYSFKSGLHQFTGQGKHGELLHDLFDGTVVMYEIDNEVELDIMTLWGNEGPNELANELWNCFYLRLFPDDIERDEITLVCMSLDRKDYKPELIDYLNKFDEGWLPPNE